MRGADECGAQMTDDVERPRQPFLHDLVVSLQAPTQAWSRVDGDITGTGAEGVFHGDRRVLSLAELTVAGSKPVAVSAQPGDDSGDLHVVGLVRVLDAPGADPTARLDRHRQVRPGRVTERLSLSVGTPYPVTADVVLRLGTDFAEMEVIKSGRHGQRAPASLAGDGVVEWRHDGTDTRVAVHAPDAAVELDGDTAVLTWSVRASTGRPAELHWSLAIDDAGAAVAQASKADPTSGAGLEWARPRVASDDRRLAPWLDRSLADLAGLRMALPDRPEDTFLAAGAPWFLTLFGRDSLWAARMLLPLGTDLALGTLRVLASRQGHRTDPVTAEQPGKILHELRRDTPGAGRHFSLPPVYFGTVDATPLWVLLLHDAWRWGLSAEHVASLLPHLERALDWLTDHADPDGDGFLEYVDESGAGLANQGWKDSGDSIQWRSGELAQGPIALAEVQAYAFAAARAGAALLDAFGRPGGDRYLAWAEDIAARFRKSFWVADDAGPYPAIALDADKRPVDTLTSNVGHLLGTGILSAEESAIVASRLGEPRLDSGFGLRTMAEGSGGYWQLRYHGGSVWPHDTAIAISGLLREGLVDSATSLTQGLLAAAPSFGYRLPELFGGDRRGEVLAPVPYPAACRPQAWSAAASVAVLTAALGLTADVPAGTLTCKPPSPSPVGAVRVEGLRIAGSNLTVDIAADGHVRAVEAPPGIEVITPA